VIDVVGGHQLIRTGVKFLSFLADGMID